MKIVKVDATESTNTFLKELCVDNDLENFTVVITKNQTKGRGQMHSGWESEIGKNLTFSVLIRFCDFKITNQFYLSKAISIAVFEVLAEQLVSKISIKWPNDIMSAHHKICGILIENTVKKAKVKDSIVGIGLNVNQTKFEDLPNAISMRQVSGFKYNLDELLNKLMTSIEKYTQYLVDENFELIDKLYLQNLHKFETPSMFQSESNVFIGKIIGVSQLGKLMIELEDESIKKFDLKEIQFL